MHVDLDAFFASCEEARDPSLKAKPLVIGADPKAGKGRGVVSTANYKAREFGIHSAMPITKAYNLCPHANFIQGTRNLYGPTSKRIFTQLQTHNFVIEQVGIDEAYVDISQLTHDEAKNLSKEIQKEVKQSENITISIGIGPNKMIAKIASDFKKPEGITIVKKEEAVQFIAPLEIRKIPGIGPKTAEKMHKHNIYYVKDLQKLPLIELNELFGKTQGERLHNKAKAISSTTVGNNRKRKGISKEKTFSFDTDDNKKIHNTLNRLANNIFIHSLEKKFIYKTVAIKLRYKGFITHTAQKGFKAQPNLREILRTITQLLEKNLQKEKKVRLVGVRFS